MQTQPTSDPDTATWQDVMNSSCVDKARVVHYTMTQLPSLLENPSNGVAYRSFCGDLYEALFYECLIANLSRLHPAGRLLPKGPYTERTFRPANVSGFHADRIGNCLYSSVGISLSEFDALVISDDEIYAYECTLAKSPRNAFQVRRKSELLIKLFPDHSVHVVCVSPNELCAQAQMSSGYDSVVLFESEMMDPELFRDGHDNPVIQPIDFPSISYQELNDLTACVIDYYAELKRQCVYGPRPDHYGNELLKEVPLYITKTYLGVAAKEDMPAELQFIDTDEFYLALTRTTPLSPLRVYYRGRDNNYYAVHMCTYEIERLHPRKCVVSDMRRIGRELKRLKRKHLFRIFEDMRELASSMAPKRVIQ